MGDSSSRQQGWGRISAMVLQTRRRLKWASYLCSTVLALQYLMQSAEAEPVLGTSLFRQCRPVALANNKTEDCCLPEPEREPIMFKFPEVKKMLVRRPAHELANDVEYVNKYNLAYKRMKELPRDDPRSFLRQWHVKDTLSNAKLGIMYQDMSEADSLWINHKPKASKPSFRASEQTQMSSTPDDYPEVVANANNTIGSTPVCFKLHRRAPTKADLKGTQVKHIGELSEGVVMEKVKIPEMMYVRFDVYVDFPSANLDSDMDQSDYVGTFTHLPSGVASMESVTSQIPVANENLYRELNVRFTTGLALRRLGIEDYSTDITVTIVPRFRDHDANRTITFSNLKQEFL
ncbi:hypothetical protein AXG93_492s1020 [Marchantia polymorpha subsp. ruderalis]|uniref:Polyphenol oxidase C-terminal domain-containing protein n=1 Tax=Marchantia polymorpha subsp. ruderalis TaxID=1480154 RepID=A0A176W5U9_MARPO|nr:hypothetical protein AXG93_492s1020 [Marchantia polymorpha subsp. ruderalis]